MAKEGIVKNLNVTGAVESEVAGTGVIENMPNLGNHDLKPC
ncbi:MAG: hypothetical protein ACI4PK_04395 [Oscillospiraceae bacterium]